MTQENKEIPLAPLKERMPKNLLMFAYDLEKKHFGAIPKMRSGDVYAGYLGKIYVFMYAIESLAREGEIPSDQGLFDATKRIRPDLTNAELEKFLIEDKPLKGKSIGVVGGPEGRFFAELGADTAVSIDPNVASLRLSNMSNLAEIPMKLTPVVAAKFGNFFDLTFTSRLFDYGSGLDSRTRHLGDSSSFDDENVYGETLDRILRMTKKHGLSVHENGMVQTAIDESSVPLLVKETTSTARKGLPGSSDVFLLQRL